MSGNRHRTKRWPDEISTAMKEIGFQIQVTENRLDAKRQILEGSLSTAFEILRQAGGVVVPLSLTDGARMFVDSSLSDYLDGSEFTAFSGECDGVTYSVVMSVTLEEEDVDGTGSESRVSSSLSLMRESDGTTETLTDEGWQEVDDEENDGIEFDFGE